MFRTLYSFPSRDLFPMFYKRTMPYNKKLTDLNRSGSTGKYPTSVLLYWPRYRSVNTASPRLDIFLYCPHFRSVIIIFSTWHCYLCQLIWVDFNYSHKFQIGSCHLQTAMLPHYYHMQLRSCWKVFSTIPLANLLQFCYVKKRMWHAYL